jgi:hypothetical protein
MTRNRFNIVGNQTICMECYRFHHEHMRFTVIMSRKTIFFIVGTPWNLISDRSRLIRSPKETTERILKNAKHDEYLVHQI